MTVKCVSNTEIDSKCVIYLNLIVITVFSWGEYSRERWCSLDSAWKTKSMKHKRKPMGEIWINEILSCFSKDIVKTTD